MKRSLPNFLILCVLTTSLSAGEIEPLLRSALANASEDDYLRVVARLLDRVDIRALDESLRLRRATRAERNYEVITALQRKAAETQGPVLTWLQEQQMIGSVENFERYWIDNLIMLKARPSAIEQLAARSDIEMVFLETEIVHDPPLDFNPAPDRVTSAEPGLRAINAPLLWRIGITGRGRLVMNIDTGVNGNHPALASRWRGTLPGVQWNHAWYGSGTFPVDSDNPGHGTHTMGTMTGFHLTNLDTVGVAPDAYWIAGSSSYVGAFQWAVNPDGNPGTVDDVPDVINCSWFTSASNLCTGGLTYWSLMDNVEAAGAAVIWSAGNCGPSGSPGSCTGGATPGPYMTITPPKNRITTDVNAFAVGALDGNNPSYPIAGFSSRGPSACDTTVKKPEVSAPGVSVRSTIANGSFGTLSGTSMAAPHVSGAVALLRQINPNADAHQIKRALLTTARDLGTPGEDNSYGMGIIDVFAAAEVISPYRISGIIRNASTLQPINLAKVEILQTLQQRFSDSTGSYRLGVLKDTVSIRYSAFGYFDTTLQRILQPNVPETVNVTLNPLPLATINGSVTDSVSGQGIVAHLLFYGYGDPGTTPRFTTVSQPNGSYSINVPIGTYRVVVVLPAPYVNSVTVGSLVVTTAGVTQNFAVKRVKVLYVDDDRGETTETVLLPSLNRLNYSFRYFSVVDSGVPPANDLTGFPTPPVVLWMTGTDSTGALTAAERRTIVNHLSAGGTLILSGNNIAEFSVTGDTLLEMYLGVRFTANSSVLAINGFAGDVIGNSVTNWFASTASKDVLMLLTGGLGMPAKTLYHGSDTTSIAGVRVAGPTNNWAATYFTFTLDRLAATRVDSMIRRSMRYFDQVVVGVAEQLSASVPGEFRLEQNYPNPFNPTTTIEFELPEAALVTIRVYDLLGQQVATLTEGKWSAGTHRLIWDAGKLASGVYFIRLSMPRGTQVRKAILMR